jgi:hypothetical protein
VHCSSTVSIHVRAQKGYYVEQACTKCTYKRHIAIKHDVQIHEAGDNGPSPPDLNKNRVLTLKLAARCGSRVFRVQLGLAKGLGVGLISGPTLLKYLLDLAIMIAKNVAPRHKQSRNLAIFLVYLAT